MELIVIRGKNNNTLVAVVEKLPNMSAAGTALAWAKANGYEKFPNDAKFDECSLTTFGSVMLRITPTHEVEALNAAE